MEVTEEMDKPVTNTTQNAYVNMVSTALIFTNFFMGRTPLHTWEHFSERITFFYRAIVSEVHVLQAQDLHFGTPLKLNQIVHFKVGRVSTRRDQSNAPKIIFVRPPDPEIVRSELWARKIAACDAMWPTANLFENGNKSDLGADINGHRSIFVRT